MSDPPPAAPHTRDIRRQSSEGLVSFASTTTDKNRRAPMQRIESSNGDPQSMRFADFSDSRIFKHSGRHFNLPISNGNNGNGASVHQNDESHPLTKSSREAEYEECELLDDTFSFLMTARYPFEKYCCKSCCSRGQNKADENKPAPTPAQYDREDIISISEELTMESNVRSKLNKADADWMCLPFWVGMFVNMSQLFIYCVVIGNVFLGGELPPNADRWLRLAQIFSVIVTLYTQSDFIDGIFLLTERWKAFKDVTTPAKFNFSAIMRILAGNVGILATFILVMYSTEVVDLLLNFAAMEFVATLDDSAFEIASKGFLGVTLEKKALEIQDFRYIRRTQRGSIFRISTYVFYVFLVFGAFITIAALQAKRVVGVDNEVYVQFDDTDLSDLYGISGVYRGCLGFRTRDTGDIGYVRLGLDCPTKINNGEEFPSHIFVYCWDLDGWAYLDNPTTVPCDETGHLIRSFVDDEENIASNSFDILNHAKANWIVTSSLTGGETFLEVSFIESVQRFKSGFLDCPGGLEFLHKDNVKRRPFLPIARNSSYYPTFEGTDKFNGLYSEVFGLAYRPIFRKEILWQNPGKYQVVLFDGLRWLYLVLNPLQFANSTGKLGECNQDEDPDCWKVFISSYLTSTAWLLDGEVTELRAISDPMLYLTPSDTGLPRDGLAWYEPQITGDIVQPAKEIDSVVVDDGVSGDGGSTSSYGFQCAPILDLACAENEVALDIKLTTDIFPWETRVGVFYGQSVQDLGSLNKSTIVYAESILEFAIEEAALVDFNFLESRAEHTLGTCIPVEEACVQVVVIDTFGDGIFDPGEYSVSYDNATLSGGGFIDAFFCRSYQFGSACLNTTRSSPNNCSIAEVLSLYPGEGGNGDEADSVFDDDFTVNGTLVPSGISQFSDNENYGTFNPSGGSCTSVLIDAQTDSNPDETHFLFFYGDSLNDVATLYTAEEVFGDTTNFFSMSEGVLTDVRFSGSEELHIIDTCAELDSRCLQVVAIDTAGNGMEPPAFYNIFGDFEGFGQGNGTGWGCRSYQFGSNCADPFRPNPTDCSYVDDILNAAGSQPTCEDDEVFLLADVITDQYPIETQLLFYYGQNISDIASLSAADQVFVNTTDMFSISDGVLTDVRFSEADQEYYLDSCAATGSRCLQMVFVDSFGDGLESPAFYNVSNDVQSFRGNGTGWGCRLYQFGANCIDPFRSNPTECSYADDILNVYPGRKNRE